MRTAEQSGYPEIPDLQSLDSNNGFQRWLRYMSPDGERSDTAHAYLHPLLRDGKHPNLHVLVQSKVVRVLFDEHKRACGVEFTPNPQFQMVASYATPHPKQTVRARKLVIVTCGACGTPSVLERSGLGAKDVLERAAVPLVEELPGIGHDYQDHQLVAYVYKSSLKPEETADALLTGRLSVEDAIAQKHPHLQWNFIDIASKLRPTEAEVAALGPEFQAAWDRDFKDKPNRPLILMASCAGTIGDTSGMPPNEYISVGPYTAYPYSRGHMHITGPDVTDAPDFDLGFFSDAHDVDLKKQVWAYKKSREMMRRSGVYAGELAAFHPRFPAGSAAACIEDWDAAGGAAPPTHAYTAEDDAAIEQHLRENAQTAWHALGTAKMAPREDMGVVDASLSVYGVKGLKVADLSIVPENVGANTNNTAMAVGEKAADIIAKELGLTP
ncbi:GMC oxidoreductase-domain-containing protein, partial [Hypoxylon sp. FL1284]